MGCGAEKPTRHNEGVFPLTTKIAIIPVKRMYIVNGHIHKVQPSHKKVSEVRNRAYEQSEQMKRA